MSYELCVSDHIFTSAGIMDILVTFQGDVKYPKLDMPEQRCWTLFQMIVGAVCASNQSQNKSINKVTKEGEYYKIMRFSVYLWA